MFFKPVDLTTALRPSLLPDETLLFVQDGIGLYDGKFKIPAYQQGHAYLTSHRACYVDDAEPRTNSVALDLRDVDRSEIQIGFLRSSPKITLFPKPLRVELGSLRLSVNSPTPLSRAALSSSSSPLSRTNSPFPPATAPTPSRQSSGTWVCPICSFSNPVPSNFDAGNATSVFPLPPCLACGIKPPFAHVLKAAIAAAIPRHSTPQTTQENLILTPSSPRCSDEGVIAGIAQTTDTTVTCPRCTFHNHPSLLACEVCGAPLPSSESLATTGNHSGPIREESPGPRLEALSPDEAKELESMKFSFRTGGEKVFHERLKGALVQRKWLLRNAPPIPKSTQSPVFGRMSPDSGRPDHSRAQASSVGIAGLERRGMQSRKNNELVIGNAFEDLEALMASAKDIVALAEQFASESGGGSTQANSVISESAAALGMVTTKDLLGGASESLYISELSRNLAEYLTDDRKGVLKGEGGVMSLVDLWAVFNRSRNGVELVSPSDFEKAAQLWEKLGLPVRLRRFKSGLLVVQRREWNDEKIIHQMRMWFQEMHILQTAKEELIDWRLFGRGVTAQEAAQRFGWSVGVASEELEMAEEKGILCREEGIEGLKFWENHLVNVSDLV